MNPHGYKTLQTRFLESPKPLTGAEHIKNRSATINKTQRTSQNRLEHGCLNGEQSGRNKAANSHTFRLPVSKMEPRQVDIKWPERSSNVQAGLWLLLSQRGCGNTHLFTVLQEVGATFIVNTKRVACK